MKNAMWVLPFLLLIFLSCTNDKTHLRNLLAQTDKVRLERFNGSDTLMYDVIDKTGIEIFTKTISGAQQFIYSKSKRGQIVFFSGRKVIFEAFMTEDGIEYVFNNHIYREKISYQAGMYFDDAPYK